MKHRNKFFRETKISKYIIATLTLLAIFIGLFTGIQKVSASAIPINPNDPKIAPINSIVIKRDTPVSQAEINTTGSNPDVQRETGNERPNWGSDSDGTKLVFDSPSSLNRSSVTVKYPLAVGTYGETKIPVFAKMTIHDIKVQPNAPVYTDDQKFPSIIISDKLYNGLSLNGVQQARIKLELFDKDGKNINVGDGENKTYITINSLNQAMGHGKKADGTAQRLILGNEFAGYENMNALPYYVTSDSILGTYSSPWSGDAVVGGHRDPDNAMQHPEDTVGFSDALGSKDYSKASASFQVRGSELNFVVGNSGKPSEDSKINGGETGYYNGQWISFSSATLWNAPPLKPTKDVVENGKSIDKQKVKPNEKLEYTISQPVGTMNVDMLQKYSTFKLRDPLPKEVTYLNNAYVTDGSTGDRLDSNSGNITYNDGVVEFDASSDYLSTILSYIGQKLTLHIPVQVKPDVKGGIIIENHGYSVVDKVTTPTNKVTNPTIKDPDYKVTKKIFTGTFNKVNDWDGLFSTAENNHDTNIDLDSGSKDSKDGNTTKEDSLKDVDRFSDTKDSATKTFVMQHHLNRNGNDVDSLSFEDNIEASLNVATLKDVTLFDKSGKDITNEFDVKIDGNHVSANAKNPADFDKTENIYSTIKVSLTKDYDFSNVQKDSETGDYIIPNVAKMNVNGKTYNSNEVHLLIPNPKVNPDPTKTVEDKDGNDVNHKPVNDGDFRTFRVSESVGTLGQDLLKPYKAFSYSDKLDSRLTYLNSYMVSSPKGSKTETKLSDENTTEFDKKTNTVSWHASDKFLADRKQMPLKGEKFTLVIEAKVNTKTASDITTNIRNKAEVTLNNDPKTTNEVEMPLIPNIPAPVKTVTDLNGKDINGKEVKDGDEGLYHIKQQVNKLDKDSSQRYSAFTFSDKLDKRNVFEEAYLMNETTNEKVADSNSGVAYDDSTRIVSFKADDNFLKNLKLNGDKYEFVIKYKVKLPDAKSTDSSVKSDSDSETSDENSIPNKATVTINDNPQVTNEVRNPYKPVESDDPDPIKSVTDENDKDINMKNVVDGQIIKYHLTKTIGNMKSKESYETTDTLDNRLEYQKAYVIDATTKKTLADTNSGVSYDNAKRLVKFEGNKEFVKSMQKGKTYSLVIVAKVNLSNNNDKTSNSTTSNVQNDETNNNNLSKEMDKEQDSTNVDENDLNTENIIPNIGTVSVNGKSKDTNKVQNPYSDQKDQPKTDTPTPAGNNSPSPSQPDAQNNEKLAQTGAKSFFTMLQESVQRFFVSNLR